MGSRSSKRNKKKKWPIRFLLIFAMVSALALGFFVSPILMNVIDQKIGGVTTEVNSPWRWFLTFLGKQEDPNQETPSEPEKPILPNQAFSVKFSSFSFWRLQLAVSNKKEWTEEERQRLKEQGIQAHFEDSGTGLILFLGPFLTSSRAEEQLGLAEELGYPDAFPVIWEWPEIESGMIEPEDELYTFAKAVTAYNFLANQIFSDQADSQVLNSEMQNLLNTKYSFVTEEQEVMWNESLSSLQKGVDQEEDIGLLKEQIMLRLNDFRNLFQNVAKTE